MKRRTNVKNEEPQAPNWETFLQSDNNNNIVGSSFKYDGEQHPKKNHPAYFYFIFLFFANEAAKIDICQKGDWHPSIVVRIVQIKVSVIDECYDQVAVAGADGPSGWNGGGRRSTMKENDSFFFFIILLKSKSYCTASSKRVAYFQGREATTFSGATDGEPHGAQTKNLHSLADKLATWGSFCQISRFLF